MDLAEETAYTPAWRLAELVAAGELTARELTEAAIERAETTGARLDAVIHPRYDAARAEADAGPVGPLGGVPFLLKDLAAERAGEPLTEGMIAAQRAGYRSTVTSYVVESWLHAGAVQIAKSVPAEMGMSADCEPSAHPPVRNPWNTDHSPHGSSGGSAAAVAAGVVPLAHANDAGGSIRVPASACGLVGLKPSRGRVATGPGYGDVAGGLAMEGCVSRTVRDTAIVLDATAGYRPGAPYAAPDPAATYVDEVEAGQAGPGPLRVGVWDASPAGDLDPACLAAVESAASLLGELGHHVESSRPGVLAELGMDGLGLAQYGALSAWALADWEHRLGAPVDPGTLDDFVAFSVEMGRDVTAESFLVSRQRCQEAAVVIDDWHAGHDLLVTATMPDPPARIGEVDTLRALSTTCAANLTGQPAISLPLSWSGDGLPIGVQLTAAYGREDLLVRVAAQLEAARPWADRRPPVNAAG